MYEFESMLEQLALKQKKLIVTDVKCAEDKMNIDLKSRINCDVSLYIKRLMKESRMAQTRWLRPWPS